MTTTGITDAQLLFMAKSVLCELNFLTKRLKHKKLVVTPLKLIKTSELGMPSDLFQFNWKEFFINKIPLSEWIQEKLEKLLPDWTRKVWNFTPRKSFRNALFVRETISESSRLKFVGCQLALQIQVVEKSALAEICCETCCALLRIKLKHDLQQNVDINLIKYQIT